MKNIFINNTVKKLAATTLLVLVTACANKPTHVVIAPDLSITNSASSQSDYQNKQTNITVTDMRSAQHIVQILRKDKAAEIYSSQQPLKNIIKQTLTAEFKKQGLAINAQASNTIDIIIENSLISVQQEMMDYQVNNELVILVKVNNGKQTLSNTFKVRGTSEGLLSADIAVLERDFNQQLSNLLTQIISNTEIKNFIK
ncbi:MAG: YajG family lipoprotein [Alteromonadaceae bacterium]